MPDGNGWQGRPARYGGAALLLLSTAVLLDGLLTRLADGGHLRTDLHGTTTLAKSGNVGGTVGVALMLLATASAVLGIVSAARARPALGGFAVAMLAVLGWWACAVVFLQEGHLASSDIITIFAGVVLACGVAACPPGIWGIRYLDLLRDVTVASLLLYAIAFPQAGQLACRTDKCGIFGNLVTGFMPTENSAAAMVALSVPLIAVQRSKRRMTLSIALAAALVLGTGSRTALSTLALSLVYVAYSRRALKLRTARPHLVWRWLPLGAFLVSTALFLFASPTALTGRGLLYSAMRQQLHGLALVVGSGPDTLQRAAVWLGDWTAAGEHGQAPHLLVLTGLVGWALFAVALTALAMAREWSPRRHLALGLAVAAAAQGLAEPAWALEVRTAGFVAAITAIGLMCHAHPAAGHPSLADASAASGERPPERTPADERR